MKKKLKLLEYLNSYDFLDRNWNDFQSVTFIPKVEEVLYSINTRYCQIQYKGMITSNLTDESLIKLCTVLGFLTGSPVNVKANSLDIQKASKSNKDPKKINQEDLNLYYLLESKISGDYSLDSMAIICTALSYQFSNIKYKIIPHSTGKVKLVLWISLGSCTKLSDLNKNFFREFSFANIPLKLEIVFSNKAYNLSPIQAKSFIFSYFPFYLISSKLIENYDNN